MDKKNKKLKILEITAFSAGICGVWTRVFAESKLLAKKGHEVHVFSSNIFRGGEKKFAKEHETIEGVDITRFSARFSFGDNTYFWDFKKKAMELRPDIIIVHAYRQYYSTIALNIAKKLKIPCFLITHAPFLDKKLRNWKLNFVVFLYDNIIGKRIINHYKKIIAITKWEIPELLELGAEKERIVYIPNGVPQEFFEVPFKRTKKKNAIKKLLFFGRLAPIKDIETLLKALKIIEKENFHLDIIGPGEEKYIKMLKNLALKLKINKKVSFYPAVYDLIRKIQIFDDHDIFLLTSKREGMPQALIEAMARKNMVISSRTDGGKEIIQDRYNGYLFDIGNERQLAARIKEALNNKKIEAIKRNALMSVKKFSWKMLIDKIEKIYTS